MQEYYFLFALALIYTIFATIQDLRFREVANWLNYSLIAFALSYRAFYAIENNDAQFFIFGVLGVLVFVALSYTLYYGKVFAGGDAKLLMGYGAIFPYTNYLSLITIPLIFVFLLLLVGSVYSLIFSVVIVTKNKSKFKQEFSRQFRKNKKFILFSLVFLALVIIFSLKFSFLFALIPLSLVPALLVYTKSVENCMIILLPPNKLTEGDWIEQDVKLKNYVVKKTVHGLTKKDIEMLKKQNKKILVKQGIPFVPAFLISLIITALFFALEFSFPFLSFLF